MTRPYHVPVLAEEVLQYLLTDPRGTYVDCTLGGGGHARLLAQQLAPDGLLLGLDRDPDALAAGRNLVDAFPGRVRLTQGDFGRLPEVLERLGLGPVQGILGDLGVSSHQLDEGGRGFSLLRDGPLDMRMDPERGVSAAELVNTLPEEELARIFREYGEEARAGRVARAVIRARARRPLRSTGELARLVEEALGRRGPRHPATRVFQALRIAVNRELESLDALLQALPELLAPGGRVVVIAYHSLEDRRVKQALRRWQAGTVDAGGAHGGPLRVLTKKAVKPARREVLANPRARSARLRAAERVSAALDAEGGRGGR